MKPYVIIAHIYSFVSGICFGSSFVLMIRNIFSRFELDPGTIWEIPVEWYIKNITPDRSRLQDSEGISFVHNTLQITVFQCFSLHFVQFIIQGFVVVLTGKQWCRWDSFLQFQLNCQIVSLCVPRVLHHTENYQLSHD